MIRTGQWLGDSGKGVTLNVGDNGQVSGMIQVAHGRPSPDEIFELIGFTDGELIGFTVLWRNKANNYFSVASWTGRYVNDEKGERIQTAWHLTRKYSDLMQKKENDV